MIKKIIISNYKIITLNIVRFNRGGGMDEVFNKVGVLRFFNIVKIMWDQLGSTCIWIY